MTHWLGKAMAPLSVAVIGASGREGKVGHTLMANLKRSFPGRIYPVNPGEEEIMGFTAYPSVSGLPEAADLAVVVLPAGLVPGVIRDCGEKGIKTVVVISSGFAETGAAGAGLQEEMVAAARQKGVRIIGPNCLGVCNCHIGLNASFALDLPATGGGVSLVTQSGAYAMALLGLAGEQGLGLAKVISCGNKCDVRDDEILTCLGQDEYTHIICCFLESIDDRELFLEQARQLGARKPVVLCKVGRCDESARAAEAHTAARVGDYRSLERAGREAGILVTATGLEMMEVAKGLAWQPAPRGRRVGIISNSGGLGVELVDLCHGLGLEVPLLPDGDRKALREVLPPFASPRNPVDITPTWGRFVELYRESLETLFKSPVIDIIIPVLLERSAIMPEVVAAVRDAVVACQEAGYHKPVYVCWVAPGEYRRNQEILQKSHIPCYEWPERAAKVAGLIAGWAAGGRN